MLAVFLREQLALVMHQSLLAGQFILGLVYQAFILATFLGGFRRSFSALFSAIRAAVESEGYDDERGIFVQAFGGKALDAALLLLPSFEFVAYDDERMIRTVDAIREELEEDGLLLRYRPDENLQGELEGKEGVFLSCSFWLTECLARQERMEEARMVFDRTLATSNELGLFSEEYDTNTDEMLGNFPQGLTHLSHIAAAVALAEQHQAEMRPHVREDTALGGSTQRAHSSSG